MEQDVDVQARSLSGVNFMAGMWLVISPYLLGYDLSSSKWNQTIFGVLVLLLAGLRFLAPRLEWTSWLVGLCGLWLIVAPFILNYSRGISYWNEALTGIIVSVMAFWNMDTYNEHYNRPITR